MERKNLKIRALEVHKIEILCCNVDKTASESVNKQVTGRKWQIENFIIFYVVSWKWILQNFMISMEMKVAK